VKCDNSGGLPKSWLVRLQIQPDIRFCNEIGGILLGRGTAHIHLSEAWKVESDSEIKLFKRIPEEVRGGDEANID